MHMDQWHTMYQTPQQRWTLRKLKLSHFLGLVKLFKSLLIEVISQQWLLQPLTELTTLEAELFRSGLTLCFCSTIPTRGCLTTPLRPAELQLLATRRKDLFTLCLLLSPASVWRNASLYSELWLSGGSRNNMIPFSSPVRQPLFLSCQTTHCYTVPTMCLP